MRIEVVAVSILILACVIVAFVLGGLGSVTTRRQVEAIQTEGDVDLVMGGTAAVFGITVMVGVVAVFLVLAGVSGHVQRAVRAERRRPVGLLNKGGRDGK